MTIFDICAIVLAAGLLLLDFCLTKKQKEYLKDIVYLGWTRVEFSTFSSFIIASSSVTFRLFRKLVGGDFHSVRGLSRVIAANGAIMLSAIMLMAIFADVNYGLNFDCLKPSPYVQFKCRFMYIGGAYPIQNVLVAFGLPFMLIGTISFMISIRLLEIISASGRTMTLLIITTIANLLVVCSFVIVIFVISSLTNKILYLINAPQTEDIRRTSLDYHVTVRSLMHQWTMNSAQKFEAIALGYPEKPPFDYNFYNIQLTDLPSHRDIENVTVNIAVSQALIDYASEFWKDVVDFNYVFWNTNASLYQRLKAFGPSVLGDSSILFIVIAISGLLPTLIFTCVMFFFFFISLSRPVLRPLTSIILARIYESEKGVLSLVAAGFSGLAILTEKISKLLI